MASDAKAKDRRKKRGKMVDRYLGKGHKEKVRKGEEKKRKTCVFISRSAHIKKGREGQRRK